MKTKVKHTQGPWEIAGVVDASIEQKNFYGLPSGFLITHKTPEPGFLGIAAVFNRAAETQDSPNEETEANARLIAAAPELLYALEEALWHLGDHAEGHAMWRTDELAPNIKAAIAKATE